jgi:hypothetical protein
LNGKVPAPIKENLPEPAPVVAAFPQGGQFACPDVIALENN